MKFDIKEAVFHIFNDKNLLLKVFIFCVLIFIALALGAVRSFFISELYYGNDDISNRLFLTSTNFQPDSLFKYLGFPMVPAYLYPFDISQLLTAGFTVVRIKAVLFILLAICTVSPVTGYFLHYMHNYALSKENKLPELKNVSAYFKKGLEYFAICFVLTIPILIINLIGYVLTYDYFESYGNSDLSWLFSIIRAMVVLTIINILATISFLYLSVATLPYICTLQAKSVLNFKKSISFVYKNIKTFCKYLGFLLLFTVIFALFLVVIMFLNRLIEDPANYTSSFITSGILIIMSLPLLFWHIAAITNIQAQLSKEFLNYTIAIENHEKFNITLKSFLVFIAIMALLAVLLISVTLTIQYLFMYNFMG